MSTRLQPSSHAVHWFPTAFWFLALGFLWFVLISQLRIEWTLNPQYSYGWAVPPLSLARFPCSHPRPRLAPYSSGPGSQPRVAARELGPRHRGHRPNPARPLPRFLFQPPRTHLGSRTTDHATRCPMLDTSLLPSRLSLLPAPLHVPFPRLLFPDRCTVALDV